MVEMRGAVVRAQHGPFAIERLKLEDPMPG